jgi:hypothetical protein
MQKEETRFYSLARSLGALASDLNVWVRVLVLVVIGKLCDRKEKHLILLCALVPSALKWEFYVLLT